MFTNNWLTFLLINFSVVLLTACGDGETSNTTSNEHSKNISADQTKFIKIEDATTFLPSWSKENVLVYNVVGEPDEMHPTNGIIVYRSEIMGYTQVYPVSYTHLTLPTNREV